MNKKVLFMKNKVFFIYLNIYDKENFCSLDCTYSVKLRPSVPGKYNFPRLHI